jgi:hypothetical protein
VVSSLDWDITSDDEIPRPGLPDAERLARRQRWYRRLVWSSVVLAPVALLAVLVVAGSTKAPKAPTQAPAPSVSSRGRTAATQELDAWLAETPSPLPGATVLSWDGARTIAPEVAQSKGRGGLLGGSGSGGQPTWVTEIDTFTLVVPPAKKTASTVSGTTTQVTQASVYQAAVAVALDPTGTGAVAMGGPSITKEPKTTTSGWFTGGPWPGISSSNAVSGPVQQAINGWVGACTGGSAAALSLAVGDTNSAHTYVPLSGVQSASATVVAAAPRIAPNSPIPSTARAASTVHPTAEIVEITLDIRWNGESAPKPGTQGLTGAPKTTMDLLVERADTAAPVVVAWGPQGTGPTLVPYQNAVTG